MVIYGSTLFHIWVITAEGIMGSTVGEVFAFHPVNCCLYFLCESGYVAGSLLFSAGVDRSTNGMCFLGSLWIMGFTRETQTRINRPIIMQVSGHWMNGKFLNSQCPEGQLSGCLRMIPHRVRLPFYRHFPRTWHSWTNGADLIYIWIAPIHSRVKHLLIMGFSSSFSSSSRIIIYFLRS